LFFFAKIIKAGGIETNLFDFYAETYPIFYKEKDTSADDCIAISGKRISHPKISHSLVDTDNDFL